MRDRITKQLRLVEPGIHHDHASELARISKLLAGSLEIFDLVHADLLRGLSKPDKGRIGEMTAEQVLKVLLVKQMNGFSYHVLRFHLSDSRTYRSFCGFGIADTIPSESTLQRDIAKITPKTLEAINQKFISVAAKLGIEKGRTVRTDCTVVLSNIHHPLDSSLLWDGVRVLCRITQKAHKEFGIVVTDRRKRAKRRSLGILNAKNEAARKPLYRDLLKVATKAADDAQRVIEQLKKIPTEKTLVLSAIIAELQHFIPLTRSVIDQARRRVMNGEKLKSEEKLVSIFEPHTDIIVKDRRDTLYGHKFAVTAGKSGLITDLVILKGNPADATLAVEMMERHENIFGAVPRQAAFDGGFASKSNLETIKAMGVKDVMFSKKRGLEIHEMAKSTWVYKKLRDFRAGIEGMISFLKRCFGLDRCNRRGFEAFQSYAWSSVLCANLILMARRMDC